ncbi:hypothetical protein [Shewanella sp.]
MSKSRLSSAKAKNVAKVQQDKLNKTALKAAVADDADDLLSELGL